MGPKDAIVIANNGGPDRLLLIQEQSNVGLHCLSDLLCQYLEFLGYVLARQRYCFSGGVGGSANF